MATDAGHPGRTNEDFAGAVPSGMVLVDGAGGIAGAEKVCHHGVTWYASRLGGALLGTLSQDRSLRDVLAESIERITDEHRDTCDVAHSISPCAAVAASSRCSRRSSRSAAAPTAARPGPSRPRRCCRRG